MTIHVRKCEHNDHRHLTSCSSGIPVGWPRETLLNHDTLIWKIAKCQPVKKGVYLTKSEKRNVFCNFLRGRRYLKVLHLDPQRKSGATSYSLYIARAVTDD